MDLALRPFVLEALRNNNGEPLDYEAALAMLQDFVEQLKAELAKYEETEAHVV